MKISGTRRGFTLIELLTVISIIGLLVLVGLLNGGDFRAKARDSVRKDDVQQLGAAVRLFVDRYGRWPNCTGGVILEPGGGQLPSGGSCPDEDLLLNFLTEAFGAMPVDPKGPGDSDYYYYYDSDRSCEGDPSVVVFAVNLEREDSNASEVCGSTTNNNGGYDNTAGVGGSINPSVPYVVRLDV